MEQPEVRGCALSEVLHLYAVHFVARGGTERVVILHASSPADALYCISEGWGKPRKGACVTRIDDLQVGVMRVVYERKAEEKP